MVNFCNTTCRFLPVSFPCSLSAPLAETIHAPGRLTKPSHAFIQAVRAGRIATIPVQSVREPADTRRPVASCFETVFTPAFRDEIFHPPLFLNPAVSFLSIKYSVMRLFARHINQDCIASRPVKKLLLLLIITVLFFPSISAMEGRNTGMKRPAL